MKNLSCEISASSCHSVTMSMPLWTDSKGSGSNSSTGLASWTVECSLKQKLKSKWFAQNGSGGLYSWLPLLLSLCCCKENMNSNLSFKKQKSFNSREISTKNVLWLHWGEELQNLSKARESHLLWLGFPREKWALQKARFCSIRPSRGT